MTRTTVVAALLAASLGAQAPRDIGPLTELETHLAPDLQGPQAVPLILPVFSDAHVQFFGPGWNEALWRGYLMSVKIAEGANPGGVRAFVGLGDYGGQTPWEFSSLAKFAEILHGEMTTSNVRLIAGIGNHEWFGGAGKRPWLEAIYPAVTFSSFVSPTESDRPMYHSHVVGDPAGTHVRVVVSDSSGTEGPGWISPEVIHDEQLWWLHKELVAARAAGSPTIVFDHYPDVIEVGTTLAPLLSNGFQRLRTVLQFDNVRYIVNGHVGQQRFRLAGNQMRPGNEFITVEMGPQAFRARAGGWLDYGYLWTDGSFIEYPPTYALYGPEDYGHPWSVYHYGHATISNVQRDPPILASCDQMPVAGSAVAVRATGVPPGSQGTYLICGGSDVLGTPAAGIVWFVDPTVNVPVNVVADAAGHAVAPIPLGAGTARASWWGQFVFQHATTGELLASDAHRIIVQ